MKVAALLSLVMATVTVPAAESGASDTILRVSVEVPESPSVWLTVTESAANPIPGRSGSVISGLVTSVGLSKSPMAVKVGSGISAVSPLEPLMTKTDDIPSLAPAAIGKAAGAVVAAPHAAGKAAGVISKGLARTSGVSSPVSAVPLSSTISALILRSCCRAGLVVAMPRSVRTSDSRSFAFVSSLSSILTVAVLVAPIV